MAKRTGLGRARPRSWLTAVALAATVVLGTGCLTDLRTEVGADASPTAINDNGVMAGTVGSYTKKPFRFDPGQVRVPLADPQSGAPRVVGINNALEIAGEVVLRPPGGETTVFPVAWDATGAMTDLRPFIPNSDKPGALATVVDITESGLVIGSVSYFGPPSGFRGDVFVVDIRTRQGHIVPPEISGDVWIVTGANDAGATVGRNDSGWFRLTTAEGSYRIDMLPNFAPWDINNNGDMVGEIAGVTPAVWKAGAPAPVALPTTGLAAETNFLTGRIADTGEVLYGTSFSAVRWRTPESEPESFPPEWTSVHVIDVSNRGTAIVSAYNDTGVADFRWDWA